MTAPLRHHLHRPTRKVARRADEGTALVEFAFVGVLLVFLVMGILNYGLILSFDQDMTRAAAEGARAGAVEAAPSAAPVLTPAGTYATDDPRLESATLGTTQVVDEIGQECNVGAMACTVTIHDCGTDPIPASVAYWANGVDDCVTVELIYDYDSDPLIVEPPLLSAVLPDTIRAISVARLNE